jgi:CBS domain-containing protein
MRVSEILRIKGHTLFTTAPGGPALDAVKAMAQHDIGSLVVMDRGRLVGMLTFREVLDALARRDGALGRATVEELYERDPLTATPDLDVMELRRVMLERHARYVPVMDGATLLGVVSFHDVAKAVYEDQSFENQMLKSYIGS